MNDAGAFSSELVIPETAVPGQAMVSAYPYNVDWCDDTGKNNRVGAPESSGALEIQRISCVMPSQPLAAEEIFQERGAFLLAHTGEDFHPMVESAFAQHVKD